MGHEHVQVYTCVQKIRKTADNIMISCIHNMYMHRMYIQCRFFCQGKVAIPLCCAKAKVDLISRFSYFQV